MRCKSFVASKLESTNHLIVHSVLFIYLFVCLVFCYSIYSFISLFIYFSQAVNAILLTQQGWTSLLLNCSVNQ